jgi:hypothetical protein
MPTPTRGMCTASPSSVPTPVEQVRARDRAWLRIDVVTDNRQLRRYYESAGFLHRRDVAGEFVMRDGTRRPWTTSLYERSSIRKTD